MMRLLHTRHSVIFSQARLSSLDDASSSDTGNYSLGVPLDAGGDRFGWETLSTNLGAMRFFHSMRPTYHYTDLIGCHRPASIIWIPLVLFYAITRVYTILCYI